MTKELKKRIITSILLLISSGILSEISIDEFDKAIQ